MILLKKYINLIILFKHIIFSLIKMHNNQQNYTIKNDAQKQIVIRTIIKKQEQEQAQTTECKSAINHQQNQFENFSGQKDKQQSNIQNQDTFKSEISVQMVKIIDIMINQKLREKDELIKQKQKQCEQKQKLLYFQEKTIQSLKSQIKQMKNQLSLRITQKNIQSLDEKLTFMNKACIARLKKIQQEKPILSRPQIGWKINQNIKISFQKQLFMANQYKKEIQEANNDLQQKLLDQYQEKINLKNIITKMISQKAQREMEHTQKKQIMEEQYQEVIHKLLKQKEALSRQNKCIKDNSQRQSMRLSVFEHYGEQQLKKSLENINDCLRALSQNGYEFDKDIQISESLDSEEFQSFEEIAKKISIKTCRLQNLIFNFVKKGKQMRNLLINSCQELKMKQNILKDYNNTYIFGKIIQKYEDLIHKSSTKSTQIDRQYLKIYHQYKNTKEQFMGYALIEKISQLLYNSKKQNTQYQKQNQKLKIAVNQMKEQVQRSTSLNETIRQLQNRLKKQIDNNTEKDNQLQQKSKTIKQYNLLVAKQVKENKIIAQQLQQIKKKQQREGYKF